MAKKKPDKEKIDNHIRLIICRNEKEKAADLILQNGYANSIQEARKIVDRFNGK